MSGGGSGGSPYDTTGEVQIDCAKLVERTYINSAVPELVAPIKVGDALGVEVRIVDGAATLIAFNDQHQIVGSLTPPRLPQIVACLQKGFSYEAIVLEKSGGRIKVEIRAP